MRGRVLRALPAWRAITGARFLPAGTFCRRAYAAVKARQRRAHCQRRANVLLVASRAAFLNGGGEKRGAAARGISSARATPLRCTAFQTSPVLRRALSLPLFPHVLKVCAAFRLASGSWLMVRFPVAATTERRTAAFLLPIALCPLYTHLHI